MVARLMVREADRVGIHMSVRELLDTLAGIEETLLPLPGRTRTSSGTADAHRKSDPIGQHSTTCSHSMPMPRSGELGLRGRLAKHAPLSCGNTVCSWDSQEGSASPIACATPRTGGHPSWRRALRTNQDDVSATPRSGNIGPASCSVPPPGRRKDCSQLLHIRIRARRSPVGRCITGKIEEGQLAAWLTAGDHASAGVRSFVKSAPRPSPLRSCCTSGQM